MTLCFVIVFLVYLILTILSLSIEYLKDFTLLMSHFTAPLYYDIFPTPFPTTWGYALALMSETGITFLAFAENKINLEVYLKAYAPLAKLVTKNSPQAGWVLALKTWIPQRQTEIKLPLDAHGTPFQKAVWQALSEIPYGETCSYSELAERIGKPTAVRAVASACGKNPLAVLVPCHRVLGKGGQLRGFRWGLSMKKALLDAET
jgi:AraC family transcriptional regulator of adaptative response/methylated-DNA-[protein]-cysteine methyltransferase